MLILVRKDVLRRLKGSDSSIIYVKLTKCSSTPLDINQTCIYFPHHLM